MNTATKKRWFEKHPRANFIAFLIISIVILDIISATLFIPFDYNSFRCPDPYFHHGLIPNQATKNKWGDKEFEIFTNVLGFKDHSCRIIPLQSNKKRIVFIGDSFTESVGMNWEDSFVGILAKEIPDIELLNAGVVSYSPKLHYLKIKYLIENVSLQFDEVYVLVDNSDILDELTYRNFEPYDQNTIKKLGYKLRRYFFHHSYIFYSVINYINQNQRNEITKSWNPFSGNSITDESALQDDDFIGATLDWSYKKEKYERWGKEGLELAGENMDKLHELCGSNRVKMKVVIYPWPNLIQRGDLNNIQVQFWEIYCKEKNIEFINLYPAFIQNGKTETMVKKYFIPGDVHWNEKGNRYVAALIRAYIIAE